MGFFHQWLPMQFDDHVIKVQIDKDYDGQPAAGGVGQGLERWAPTAPTSTSAAPRSTSPTTRAPVRSSGHDLTLSGRRRLPHRHEHPAAHALPEGGHGLPAEDGTWGHGFYQGADIKVEGLTSTPRHRPRRRHLAGLNETLCRFEADDGRVGHGMWENLCMGLYLPAGFDRPDAVAP